MPYPLRFFGYIAVFWLFGAAALAAETCKLDKVVSLTLGYAEGLTTTQARINGTEVTLGIDTGAQTLVTPQTAERLHLPHDARRRTREIGATAITIASNVIIRDFEFAGRHHGPKSVASISLAAPQPQPASKEASLAGLIGADVLSEYDIDFDLGARSMTLYKVSGCTKFTPPWTESYTSFPVRVTGEHHVVIPVELDGTKLTALIDTGATGIAISRKAALRSGVTEAMLKADPVQELTGVGGVAAKQPAHRFQTLVLAGETIRNIPLQLMPNQLPGADVLVGQVYLLFRHVWISYATRTLFVGPPKMPPRQQVPEPFVKLFAPTAPQQRALQPPPAILPRPAASACPEGKTCAPEGFGGLEGVSLSPEAVEALRIEKNEGTPVLIVDVLPEGPAAEAGIGPGDIVLSADGLPLFGAEALYDLIKMKGQGYRLDLAILRRSQRLSITLTLVGLGRKQALEAADDGQARRQRRIQAETVIQRLFDSKAFAIDAAASQVRLGDALRERGAAKRGADLDRAVEAYLAALRVLTPTAQPVAWARAEHGIGAVYRARDGEAGGPDLDTAIERLEAAYEVRLQHGLNADLAETRVELGLAYLDRRRGTPTENAGKAIAYLGKAAEFYSPSKAPDQYRRVQLALARAYLKDDPPAAGDRFDAAILSYERALSVMGADSDAAQAEQIRTTLDTLRARKAALRPRATPEEERTVTDCDRLAGGPFDPERVTDGVRRESIDIDKAVPACEEAVAAHPGVPRFRYQLARALHAKDPERASLIYKPLALEGYAPAMLGLAALYAVGRGVPQDRAEALRLAKQAAQPSFPFGYFALGNYYRRGSLGVRDAEEAARLYRKASDLGLNEAVFALAEMYGRKEVPVDKGEAVSVLRRASDLGSAAATFYLAFRFETGDGVAQDKAEAARLYRIASDKGNGAASYRLAILYRTGEGVVADAGEAERLLRRAADLGYQPVAGQ